MTSNCGPSSLIVPSEVTAVSMVSTVWAKVAVAAVRVPVNRIAPMTLRVVYFIGLHPDRRDPFSLWGVTLLRILLTIRQPHRRTLSDFLAKYLVPLQVMLFRNTVSQKGFEPDALNGG